MSETEIDPTPSKEVVDLETVEVREVPAAEPPSATPYVNFVVEFSRLCQGTEIPELFAVWASLSGVSAALGRRIWLDMGTYMIFPNLYVVLVASSGRFRKSTTVDLLMDVVEPVVPPINFIAQSLTPEALIGAMDKGKTGGVCEGFIKADELSTFLNRKSYDMGIAPLLIQFFDCKSKYVYETKARGKETLLNICLGMLAGTTIEWIRNAIPTDAVGGGLTSRMIFVHAEQPPKPQAWTDLSPERKAVKAQLTLALNRIRNLRGPVQLAPEARELYEKVYVKHCETSPFWIMPVLQGYASRWHCHMLSLAMIMAVSEEPAKMPVVIQARHIRAAIAILQQSEVYMPKILTMITSTEKGALGELLADHVRLLPGGVSRENLLRSVSHRVSAKEFGEVMETLVQAGRVERGSGPGASQMYFPRQR
jgi:hypothetical protein